MLAAGMLLSRINLLATIGRNALPLLGLNGVFFHFLNPNLVSVMPPHDDPVAVALFAFGVSATSLLLCAPMVYVLNKYVPQLIGKSQRAGPLLPSLETYLDRQDKPVQGAVP